MPDMSINYSLLDQASPDEPVHQKRWYAIYTRSRHEQVSHDRLVQKGFEAFLPKMLRWSQRKDRRKKILVPMFSGYLFINTDLEPSTHVSILKTPGVAGLLCMNGKPSSIGSQEINTLELLMESGNYVAPMDQLTVGDMVEVIRGPLKGAIGILKIVNSNRCLVVNVDAINRAVSVNLDRCYVKKLNDKKHRLH